MKKGLKTLLSVFLVLSFIVPINAEQSSSLFVYTSSTEGFDECAEEELAVHIYTYYGYFDSSLKLGKGITLYGEVDYPMVVYPVWKNNEIVGTFKVFEDDGMFVGSYSEGNVEQLNYARNLATVNSPLILFRLNKKMYYVIGNAVYNAAEGIGKREEIDLSLVEIEAGYLVDAASVSQYNSITVNRSAASWYLPWTSYTHDPEDDYRCYAYALSGMLRNLGYSRYTYRTVVDEISEQEGYTRIDLLNANPGVIEIYLENQGFNAYVASSDSLANDVAKSYIYDHRQYIMAGLTFMGLDGNHYGVITGYSTLNGANTYQIYEPQSTSINGLCTMNAVTKQFSNPTGTVFTWDAGYVVGIPRAD